MKNKKRVIKRVLIDGKVFKLDYSWGNLEKIAEMLKDKEVDTMIKMNLTLCMLSHDTYFQNYPVKKALALAEKYWSKELRNYSNATFLKAMLIDTRIYKNINSPNLKNKLSH